MSKPPLNYTTSIPATQTVGECSRLLADAGAEMVSITYRDRKPVGLAFRLSMGPAGPQDFILPVDIEGVARLLRNADYPPSVRPNVLAKYVSMAHAERVGWRVVKDWLEAQLSIIAAGMAKLDQVMLPYLQVQSGSLYELVQEKGRLSALER